MASVTISGVGGSYVLDDLSYELGAVQAVPEPSPLILFVIGAGVLRCRRHTRRLGAT